MDPRADRDVLPHGPPTLPRSPPATLRRRLSIDEDYFYQRIMTTDPTRPSRPPPYEASTSTQAAPLATVDQSNEVGGSRRGSPAGISDDGHGEEKLPSYSSSIELEGIFMKKHEIEGTNKRAEDRRWHTSYVTLTGTALNIYKAKKSRTWGKTRDGPQISPDNPPWMTKSKLEKTYSLLYADAGIAADYKKRRYVIRIRAETDQFLLSCIELSTFNRWMEGLFAAIDVALPIDDRDFPRDMSVPRIQRVRWFRGESPDGPGIAVQDAPHDPEQNSGEISAPSVRRSSSTPDLAVNLHQMDAQAQSASRPAEEEDEEENEELSRSIPVFDDSSDSEDGEAGTCHPPRLDLTHRLSTTSYDNAGIDPHSGKWVPDHQWTSAHDMLYAKLCYSNLLFRSPRKSNYIIHKGKKWFVDWSTGRMVRVLPPAYGEVDYFGPWQVIHTENIRI
ncbi:unnamed protein product [Clonostachys byssicola]|uniref:PH domain-containing protein n=1 Tax=Clonostachys byssicola TaxID=160290 RepID=A0A9N9U133_9HYPO|nr:unnamed protein product [Clonostachys byssicola]